MDFTKRASISPASTAKKKIIQGSFGEKFSILFQQNEPNFHDWLRHHAAFLEEVEPVSTISISFLC